MIPSTPLKLYIPNFTIYYAILDSLSGRLLYFVSITIGVS